MEAFQRHMAAFEPETFLGAVECLSGMVDIESAPLGRLDVDKRMHTVHGSHIQQQPAVIGSYET